MWPRDALGLTLNILPFYLGASLTVFNPDFTGVIRKSGVSLLLVAYQARTDPSTQIHGHWSWS